MIENLDNEKESVGLGIGDSGIDLEVLGNSFIQNRDSEDSDNDCLRYEEVENIEEAEDYVLEGRRIVNIASFIHQIQSIDLHRPFDCGFRDLKIIGEFRRGLSSIIHLECRMCRGKFDINTCESLGDKNNNLNMDVNYAATLGFMSSGGGFSQLEEVCAVLDIPSMSQSKYNSTQKQVGLDQISVAKQEMLEAIEQEKQLAIDAGDIDNDGIPYITVIGDGCYSHRSYAGKGKSLSGAATLIGLRTKKVLWNDVKNKYCAICTRFTNKSLPVPVHECNKNFMGSSAAMEAQGILKGFQESEQTYGVRFKTLVADGDSSVYNKLLENKIYGNRTITKIECRNHLYRNYRKKLESFKSKTKEFGLTARKIVQKHIPQLLHCLNIIVKECQVRKANGQVKSENIRELELDLRNIPFHVFGSHSKCRAFYCNSQNNSSLNIVSFLQKDNIWNRLMAAHNRLVNNCNSLFENETSNSVENFNALVSKFVGGKRINFSLGQNYRYRCAGAVTHFNTKAGLSRISERIFKKSPKLLNKIEQKRYRALLRNRSGNKKKFKRQIETYLNSVDYGETCNQPDQVEKITELAKSFINLLKHQQKDRVIIEQETVNQSLSEKWVSIHRNILTASNFGRICRARNFSSHVFPVLHSNTCTESMIYGQVNEPIAIKAIEHKFGIKVKKCGIFLDAVEYYLGASPDGMIDGSNGIVEVKCPKSAAGKEIGSCKLPYLNRDNTGTILGLKQQHPYFYQIQGQLHISNRDYCIFGVWTGTTEQQIQDDQLNKFLYTEMIQYDATFFKEMLPSLKKFYFEWLLPEIVDSRYNRNMPVRKDPVDLGLV